MTPDAFANQIQRAYAGRSADPEALRRLAASVDAARSSQARRPAAATRWFVLGAVSTAAVFTLAAWLAPHKRAPARLPRAGAAMLPGATLTGSAGSPSPMETSPSVEVPRALAPEPPQIIAVFFDADWCSLCRDLEINLVPLQQRLADQPVLFVTLNLSTEGAMRQSAFLAASLGLDEVWQQHGRTAGFVLLVDGRTKEVVGRLDASQRLDDMLATVQQALRPRP